MRDSTLYQNAPLSSQAQGSTAHAATATGGACHSVAIFPHRAAHVATAWRQARVWIGVAFPTIALDAALVELATAYPELAANVEH
ncbi:MAG: hypothetical protein WCG85_04840, partial [Polyangia bacterium]